MTPFRIGLTGSIGMGKSTTAGFFAKKGVPVWDADATVHRLYSPDGLAVDPIAAIWPEAIENGAVNRKAVRDLIAADQTVLTRIEAIVHPLVAADRARFLEHAECDLVVLDIPLLFEKGTDADMDATLLVTAPYALQHKRVMSRPAMTEDQFKAILSRQMPDPEKRKRATHIIETLSLHSAECSVLALMDYIRGQMHA